MGKTDTVSGERQTLHIGGEECTASKWEKRDTVSGKIDIIGKWGKTPSKWEKMTLYMGKDRPYR